MPRKPREAVPVTPHRRHVAGAKPEVSGNHPARTRVQKNVSMPCAGRKFDPLPPLSTYCPEITAIASSPPPVAI